MADEQKKIMVGYNAYFTSEKVINVAKEHVKAFNGILVVVCSVVGHSLDKAGNLANEEAAERLERLETSLVKEGIPYEMHLLVREESAGEDLVTFARDNNIFEMVVGFKKRSAIGEIVFGSNYRNMIGDAPCPIVTVHD
jgi:nucleotide-binding universal stress UspA family protein